MKKIKKWTNDNNSGLVFNYDVVDWDSDMKKSDERQSKELLLDVIMKKCNITINDLHDISIVKSKLRAANIDEILK